MNKVFVLADIEDIVSKVDVLITESNTITESINYVESILGGLKQLRSYKDQQFAAKLLTTKLSDLLYRLNDKAIDDYILEQANELVKTC